MEKNKPVDKNLSKGKINPYARVSTEDQNVEQQMKYLKDFFTKQGYGIGKVTKDVESGLTPLLERKRFKRHLEYSLKNKTPVGIYNLDRLTRNWEDVVFIERFFRENWENCSLISTSDEINLSNASGRFMFRIKMVVCCYMPEDMREKQKIGIERAKLEGKYLGRKPGSKNKNRVRSRYNS